MELENLQDGSKKMKKCKNITFCHFFAFGGPCDVQKRVKVYKVYVSWKPWLYSLRRHQKKWFLSNWGRTRCNISAQGLKMANCTSFKILTHIHVFGDSGKGGGGKLGQFPTCTSIRAFIASPIYFQIYQKGIILFIRTILLLLFLLTSLFCSAFCIFFFFFFFFSSAVFYFCLF